MELQRIFVIVLFGVFLITLIVIGIRNKKNSFSSKGKSPINKKLFVIAKLSMFIIWIITIIQALYPGFIRIKSYFVLSWIPVVIIFLGVLIIIISYIYLGTYSKFGLPTEKTELITSGLYSISRNPMYMGLFFITVGSVIYFPNWLTIILAIETIFIHHRVVLAEEVFLANTFNKKWDDYKKNTNRYI